eukprot:Tbor_TRINITY_DN5768_c2_g2::TRINITY_DN5768_c2_g2_i3::g.19575::m.19575
MSMKLAEVFSERQPICDGAEGFWGDRMKDPAGPVAVLLNTTTDPKVLRAITKFSVTVRIGDKNNVIRKVCITLRNNVIIKTHDLYREIDNEMNTLSCSKIEWATGTERMRGDSIFRFFDGENTGDAGNIQFISSALEGFDLLFQDPYGTMGNDSEDDEEGEDEENQQ